MISFQLNSCIYGGFYFILWLHIIMIWIAAGEAEKWDHQRGAAWRLVYEPLNWKGQQHVGTVQLNHH
jgi:hypothetical protein